MSFLNSKGEREVNVGETDDTSVAAVRAASTEIAGASSRAGDVGMSDVLMVCADGASLDEPCPSLANKAPFHGAATKQTIRAAVVDTR